MHPPSTTEFEELVVLLCRHHLQEEKVLGLNLASIYLLNGSRMAVNPSASKRGCRCSRPRVGIVIDLEGTRASMITRS